MHLAAGACAFDRFPDLGLHPGRLVDDEQNVPVQTLEAYPLVGRQAQDVILRLILSSVRLGLG